MSQLKKRKRWVKICMVLLKILKLLNKPHAINTFPGLNLSKLIAHSGKISLTRTSKKSQHFLLLKIIQSDGYKMAVIYSKSLWIKFKISIREFLRSLNPNLASKFGPQNGTHFSPKVIRSSSKLVYTSFFIQLIPNSLS